MKKKKTVKKEYTNIMIREIDKPKENNSKRKNLSPTSKGRIHRRGYTSPSN